MNRDLGPLEQRANDFLPGIEDAMARIGMAQESGLYDATRLEFAEIELEDIGVSDPDTSPAVSVNAVTAKMFASLIDVRPFKYICFEVRNNFDVIAHAQIFAAIAGPTAAATDAAFTIGTFKTISTLKRGLLVINVEDTWVPYFGMLIAPDTPTSGSAECRAFGMRHPLIEG